MILKNGYSTVTLGFSVFSSNSSVSHYGDAKIIYV